MKVYFLNLGWLEGDENWMAALTTYATKDKQEVMCKWKRFPVYAVLFVTGSANILYDTGMHPEEYGKSRRFPYYFEKSQLITEQLKLAGLTPAQIDKVVLSHLHDDHCGNLELFSHAEIYVARSEHDYVLQHRQNDTEPRGAYKRIQPDRYCFKLVEKEFWLTDQLKVLTLPGHSCGLLGLYATLTNESMLFTMDAVNTAVNYGPPAISPIGPYDIEDYFQSVEKIRNLADRSGAKVIFGHDMQQFQLLRQNPEFYE